ncbi:MAG TPA: hypothetical protein VKY22_17940 [Bradyrhizobium sp.]|nr:hypothetical protein [Bradyrhizobium sp.]
MLVMRYFMYVGGVLFALLLLCAAVLPKPPADDGTVASASDVPEIRIHSQQKWPERIVLDTNAQMPATAAPAKVAQAVPSQEQGSASAKARVREAFAQLPAEEPKEQAAADVKKPDPKPVVKRRVARAHVQPQPYGQQGYYPQQGYYGYPQQYPQGGRMQVAQQPRFGLLW